MKLVSYDAHKYDFKSYFTNLFECEDLGQLHEKFIQLKHFTMLNNSDTPLHDKFYDNMRSTDNFSILYERFITEFITTLFEEPFVFQAYPTLRLHFVNNWATPEFHVDTQDGYHHPLGETNFILPLVKCSGTNSVWIESESGKGDYAPIEMDYGNLWQFSGGTLTHGNMINETTISRVSVDFRVLPLSCYDPHYSKSSATRGTKFIVGGYYKELP